MSLPDINFQNIRPVGGDRRAGFEEFCCHLFRRAPEAPETSQFRRIHGAGGDGGVEAVWTCPRGNVWGLQAKYFGNRNLGASEKAQLTKSVEQAAANYPLLKRYTICFPFNLTGKKGAKSGKQKLGQHEKFWEWVDEWKDKLATDGRIVEFELWDETELLRRLAEADPSGGLTRFWFDKEVFSETWFERRLKEAKAQAGPRYSPELTIATPLDDAIQAFGRSELWVEKIEKLSNRFSDKLDRWQKTANGRTELLNALPAGATEESNTLLASAQFIEEALGLIAEKPEIIISEPFRDAIQSSLDNASILEQKLKESLLEEYGSNADTPGFRQFRAEYYVDFPMAPLDYLRNLLGVLREIQLAFRSEGGLPAAAGMLIRGEAGIGKTHGIVDATVRRSRSGLRSVVIFGEDIDGSEPWTSIACKLGLGIAEGWKSMPDAFNAAGEVSGYPLVIFIDALNETTDRRKWQSWLPPMLKQIESRPFLKLCVSCRDSYLREVIPPAFELPTIIHNGFLGQEYEAQFAFFQHFGLGMPAEPLLQREFSNPLFLRLVCEALQASGKKAIPAGREGIRSVIDLLLSTKNKKAADVCDYDHRENRVRKAVICLAGAMADAGRRQLSLSDAKALVDGRRPVAQSKSLFRVLEDESLITVIEKPAISLGGQSDYSVRFTFERIGDHLITEYLMSTVENVEKAFAPGGSLHFVVENDSALRDNAGLLEALSIQLPETHDVELIDAIGDADPLRLYLPFVAGLQWRNPSHIFDRTRQLLLEALDSNDFTKDAFEAIFSLVTRPGHPLNAAFLDQLLRSIPMLARDPAWADMLERSYSDWSDQVIVGSGVHRLIDSACRGRLESLPDDVGRLWATTLAWFCASPDRRIRDRATMAMVSIFRAQPATVTLLIRDFARCDDEYIAERVLVAGYGALLLNQSKPDLQEAASEVYNLYFAAVEPPLNASLRDHARLIIELAVELGVAPRNVKTHRYRPPYSSPWPIILPTEEEVEPFAEDRKRFPRMKLDELGLAIGTDFARYIVKPRVVDAFDIEDAGIDELDLFRWFLKRAVEFGYPGPDDRCAIFDRILLAKFGGGRGKPGWAERLGKKYYWIFLNQLVGQIADHVPRKSWSGVSVPSNDLQGLDLRDIDPTDIRMFVRETPENDPWVEPLPYVFSGPDSPNGDVAWVAENDLSDIASTLILSDNSGSQWHGLDLRASWQGKRDDRKDNSGYRYVVRDIHPLTCRMTDIDRVQKAFDDGDLSFISEPHDYRGYLAEYPQRWPYKRGLNDRISFANPSAGIDLAHVGINQLRGNEWGRNYSAAGVIPSLLMPSSDFVEYDDLRWDGHGGWLDSQGIVQVMDPWWWSDKGPGLIIRLGYIDAILEAKGKALVIMGYQAKYIAGMHMNPGGLRERTLFIRSKGETKLVGRKIERA